MPMPGLERPGTDEAWRRDLQQRVQEQIVHFRRWHRYWSAGYHAALYGAPISAFVTTLSALTRYSSTTSKVAAAVTTVLSVLAAQGRFQDKWRANRLARDQMQQLDADLIHPTRISLALPISILEDSRNRRYRDSWPAGLRCLMMVTVHQ